MRVNGFVAAAQQGSLGLPRPCARNTSLVLYTMVSTLTDAQPYHTHHGYICASES